MAADVIRTVALEPTLQNVFILGLLALIRTFVASGAGLQPGAPRETWPTAGASSTTE